MATAPQPKWIDDEDYVKPGHKLPGHTIDALIEEGKLDEAREELENLMLAGVDSGPGRVVTEEYAEEMVARARLRAGQATR